MSARLAAIALAALLVVSAQAANAQQPAEFVEIIHAASAKVVFAEGGQQGILIGAELAYGGMRLSADTVEFDTPSKMVSLEGNVRLVAPGFQIGAGRCDADLASGILIVREGISLAYAAQGVSAAADEGQLNLDMKLLQPVRAELSGNVYAVWEEGVELSGNSLSYDFAEKLCSLEDGFSAVLGPGLISPQAAALAGGALAVAGEKAFLLAGVDSPRRLLLTASGVEIHSERMGVRGENFVANLSAEENGQLKVEPALFLISGTGEVPVSGWLLDSEGNRISFTARMVEKLMGTSELVLQGEVKVSGKDFSLAADNVVAVPEGGGVRVTIPSRFRVKLAPGLFQGVSEEALAQPTG